MGLFVTGLSHRNAPVAVREQLAVGEDTLREFLHDLQAADVLREMVVLSTCNRVEVYGVADAPARRRRSRSARSVVTVASSSPPWSRYSTRTSTPTPFGMPSGSQRAWTR